MPSQHPSIAPLTSSQAASARNAHSSLSEPPQSIESDDVIATLLQRFSAADFDPDAIEFPDNTDGVYTDLAIAEHRLRVYAMVHHTPQTLGLFLLLGALEGSYLPMDSRITVREKTLLLSEQKLHWTERSVYLHTQVFGNWEEKFTIEILLPNAHPKLLSPLRLAEPRSSQEERLPKLSPRQAQHAA